VNEDDVEKFKAEIDRRELKKKNDYLADVATFYINIKSAGFISTNPFKDVSLKKDTSSIRTDYIVSALKVINDRSAGRGNPRDPLFCFTVGP